MLRFFCIAIEVLRYRERPIQTRLQLSSPCILAVVRAALAGSTYAPETQYQLNKTLKLEHAAVARASVAKMSLPTSSLTAELQAHRAPFAHRSCS